jgi:type VI secretion system secreted protein VgrG
MNNQDTRFANQYAIQWFPGHMAKTLRMMEQEGITFYFTHEKQKHTLVLADSLSIAPTFNGYSCIPYRNDDIDSRNDLESIQSWQWTEQVKPGRVVLTDYDFTRPNVNLQQQRSQARSHKLGDMEVFAYPGYFD